MDGGGLKVDAVAAELSSPDAALRETATWIAAHHPEWGADLAGFFRERLKAKDLAAEDRANLVGQVARFTATSAIQDWLAEQMRDGDADFAVRVIASAARKQVPESWYAGVTHVLDTSDPKLLEPALLAARSLPPVKKPDEKFVARLLQIGSEQHPPLIRLNALAAVPGGVSPMGGETFTFLGSHIPRDEPVAVRSLAADVLTKSSLSSEQLIELTKGMKSLAPLEVDRLLDAFAKSSDEKVGAALIEALKPPKVRSSLRIETLKPRLAKFGPNVQKEAASLYDLLNADTAKQRARLDELLTGLKEGDIRRGQAVFNSTKVACVSCHAIGYLGGTLGPDLTHIGRIRTERDLLESIVFPSASFVRSYEPMQITTKKGKTYNGLVKHESPDDVVLAISGTEEVRIARQDIDEMVPGKVSVMPAGLDQQLTRQELTDLVTFLRACK
jgi:putative heme-binding domain-containing protein